MNTYHESDAGAQDHIDGALCVLDDGLGQVIDVLMFCRRSINTFVVWLEAGANL
jgi:hypothetical protein